jgi:hypothetical protein
VFAITGQEVCGAAGDGGAKDRTVFDGKFYVRWERSRRGCSDVYDFQRHYEVVQRMALLEIVEVATGFFDGVCRREQRHVAERPQCSETCERLAPCCGIQHVGVKEHPVHGSAFLEGVVLDGVWIDPQLGHFAAGGRVVFRGDAVVQQKFGDTRWAVDFRAR